MRDETARNALKALQDGKKIKLEYEAPWYWIVGISGAERPKEAPKPYERKTTIEIDIPQVSSAPPKLTRQIAAPHLDDPIFARAMASNIKSLEEGEVKE